MPYQNYATRMNSTVGSGAVVDSTSTVAIPASSNQAQEAIAFQVTNEHASQSLFVRHGADPTSTDYDYKVGAGETRIWEHKDAPRLLGSGAGTNFTVQPLIFQSGAGDR